MSRESLALVPVDEVVDGQRVLFVTPVDDCLMLDEAAFSDRPLIFSDAEALIVVDLRCANAWGAVVRGD